MSPYENEAPQVYEITWRSGHVEQVIAHRVTHESLRSRVAAIGRREFATTAEGQRIKFHAEVGGRWTLQLSALEEDIRTIRNITCGEGFLEDGGRDEH